MQPCLFCFKKGSKQNLVGKALSDQMYGLSVIWFIIGIRIQFHSLEKISEQDERRSEMQIKK